MPPTEKTPGAMPVKTVEIDLSPAGYEGWSVTMRTNPRARVYDDFCNPEQERWWSAMHTLVLGWNLADEDGQPIPLPKDGCDVGDIPLDLMNHLVREYVAAFSATASPPKAPSTSSETT